MRKLIYVLAAVSMLTLLLGSCAAEKKEEPVNATEEQLAAAEAYSEMFGEEAAKKLAPYILTEKAEFQGACEGVAMEYVLSDEHQVLAIFSEDSSKNVLGGMYGLRAASEETFFYGTEVHELDWQKEEGKNYYLAISECAGKCGSVWYIMSQNSGTVDPDTRQEVKLSPMKTLHSEGDENFGNISVSMLSLWAEDHTMEPANGTITDVWPAHDLEIRLKNGKTLGGTKEELAAHTGNAALIARGVEWNRPDNIYFSAYFPEILDLDQAKSIVIDGTEFPLK